MPEDKLVYYDDEFILKVEHIVQAYLRDRQLTVSEAVSIRNAIKESISIIIQEQIRNCKKEQEEFKKAINAKIGLVLAIISAIISIVTNFLMG